MSDFCWCDTCRVVILNVIVSARIGLIFFLVAGPVLCFVRIVWVTCSCFSSCSVVLTPNPGLPISCDLPVRRCTKRWKGAWPGVLIWNGQRGISCHRESRPVYKLKGELTRTVLIAAGGWGVHWSPGGEQLYCASLVFLMFYSYLSPPFIIIVCFISIIKLFLFSMPEIYLFFRILSTIPREQRGEGSEQLCGNLVARWG